MLIKKNDWIISYNKAEKSDGTLLFPERLTKEFLVEQRKTLGPYIYANQYQNEIIPPGDQDFKKEWIRYYEKIPDKVYSFAFVDPAISLEKTADYTALVICHVDEDGFWYVEHAKRYRITATETVKMIFEVCSNRKLMAFGVEVVAYQQALLHFLDEEMRRRKTVIPITGIRRGPDKSKDMRIRALIPRFEWGRILLKPGLVDLEDEYTKFPRGANDDLLDALASIEDIAYAPPKDRRQENEPAPNSPGYEKWYIRQLAQKASQQT